MELRRLNTICFLFLGNSCECNPRPITGLAYIRLRRRHEKCIGDSPGSAFTVLSSRTAITFFRSKSSEVGGLGRYTVYIKSSFAHTYSQCAYLHLQPTITYHSTFEYNTRKEPFSVWEEKLTGWFVFMNARKYIHIRNSWNSLPSSGEWVNIKWYVMIVK